MKIAIVHDYLCQNGGAERVVLALARMFPGAPIYTSIYAPELTYPEFAKLEIRTSRLQGRVRPEHFRRSVFSLQAVFSELDLSGYDRVVVSSSGFAHHVHHQDAAVYCHTPPHFLYDTRRYLGSSVRAAIAWTPLSVLRWRDQAAASVRCQKKYAANSAQSARQIAKVYGHACPVIYPPLMTAHLPSAVLPLPAKHRALVVARLLPYKRVDVAIRASALAGIGLTIVGEGPEKPALQRLATGDVAFADRVSDDELAGLFTNHSVVLAPGLEDFGYGPIEANYAGRPVVALDAGGALETVENDVNGIRVAGWDPRRWSDAITTILSRAWSPGELRSTTERFGERRFVEQVGRWLGAG